MAHIPPISRKQHPQFRSRAHQDSQARSYDLSTATYDAIRPSYPAEFLEALQRHLASNTNPLNVVDLGCGTGIFTQQLFEALNIEHCVGVDTSKSMLRQAHAKLARNTASQDTSTSSFIQADAHQLPLQSAHFDLVTCAQAWHWLDAQRASAEVARITSSDAVLALGWNTLDVRVPWIHRFTRIAHTGDTLAAGFLPPMAAPWCLVEEVRLQWQQEVLAQDLFTLMHTRSYWLRAKEATRERMVANLSWYLYEHLGHTPDSALSLEYRFDGFIYRNC